MFLVTQFQPTNTEFNGTAGRGLVRFDAQPAGGSRVPIIVNIGLRVDGTTAYAVNCYLQPRTPIDASVGLEIRNASMVGFSNIGCRLPVPLEGDGTPWDLLLFTTGKTQDSTFVVSYIYGPAVLVGG